MKLPTIGNGKPIPQPTETDWKPGELFWVLENTQTGQIVGWTKHGEFQGIITFGSEEDAWDHAFSGDLEYENKAVCYTIMDDADGTLLKITLPDHFTIKGRKSPWMGSVPED